MTTTLPGSKAQHSIITDACRTGRGDDGAFEEAVARLRKVYDAVTAGIPAGKGVQIHIALTVERPAIAAVEGGDSGVEGELKATKALRKIVFSFDERSLESDAKLIEQGRITPPKSTAATGPVMAARVRRLEAACEEFQDAVLNQRHQLEEPCLDNDQTNAVLGLFDDTIGAALAAAERGDDDA